MNHYIEYSKEVCFQNYGRNEYGIIFRIWAHQMWRDDWNPNKWESKVLTSGFIQKTRSIKGTIYTDCIMFNHGEFYIHLN